MKRDLIFRLTEDQQELVRRLTGRDLQELELVVMAAPEPILLAWAWPKSGEKISPGKRHLGLGEAQESRLAPLVRSL